MSTLPAEMVRFGSICGMSEQKCGGGCRKTYDDGDEGVLVLLVRQLGVYVDTGQPTSVARM